MLASARAGRRAVQRGQALTEYALVMALLVLAAVVGLAALGGAVSDFFEGFAGRLTELVP